MKSPKEVTQAVGIKDDRRIREAQKHVDPVDPDPNDVHLNYIGIEDI